MDLKTLCFRMVIIATTIAFSGCSTMEQRSESDGLQTTERLIARYAQSASNALLDLAETDKAIARISYEKEMRDINRPNTCNSLGKDRPECDYRNQVVPYGPNQYQHLAPLYQNTQKPLSNQDGLAIIKNDERDREILKLNKNIPADLTAQVIPTNFTGDIEDLLQLIIHILPQESGWKLSLPVNRPTQPAIVTITGKKTPYEILETASSQLGSRVEITVNDKDHIIVLRYGARY